MKWPLYRSSSGPPGAVCWEATGSLPCAQAVFDHHPQDAIRHYEIGLRLGELSLGDGFAGVLPWGLIDNRPFLRCMHGYGLSLWRLGRFDEAKHIFEKMLWLNPSDNQGVRFLIDDVKGNPPGRIMKADDRQGVCKKRHNF